MGSFLVSTNRRTSIQLAIHLSVALMLPLIVGCSFPANIKEASKRQMELLKQADEGTLNYEKTFRAVIDAARDRYLDSQAKAAALKGSERLMSEGRHVGVLSEELQQVMEKARREEEVLRGAQGLVDMKVKNTKNYEDYRRYLEVIKAVQGILNAYISTDLAPEDKDIEALTNAVKQLAK